MYWQRQIRHILVLIMTYSKQQLYSPKSQSRAFRYRVTANRQQVLSFKHGHEITEGSEYIPFIKTGRPALFPILSSSPLPNGLNSTLSISNSHLQLNASDPGRKNSFIDSITLSAAPTDVRIRALLCDILPFLLRDATRAVGDCFRPIPGRCNTNKASFHEAAWARYPPCGILRLPGRQCHSK